MLRHTGHRRERPLALRRLYYDRRRGRNRSTGRRNLPIDMTPTVLTLGICRTGIQMALIDSHRVANVIARWIWSTAVFPIGQVRVIDSKMHVAIGTLGLITARTGIDRERNAAQRRVIHIDHVADDIVEFLLGVNPGADRKITFSQA